MNMNMDSASSILNQDNAEWILQVTSFGWKYESAFDMCLNACGNVSSREERRMLKEVAEMAHLALRKKFSSRGTRSG